MTVERVVHDLCEVLRRDGELRLHFVYNWSSSFLILLVELGFGAVGYLGFE